MPRTPIGGKDYKRIRRFLVTSIWAAYASLAIAIVTMTLLLITAFTRFFQKADVSSIIFVTDAILFLGLLVIWIPVLTLNRLWDKEELVKNQTKATMGILILFTVLAGTTALTDALKSRGSSPESASSQPKQAAVDAKCCPAVTVQACPGAATEYGSH